MRLRGKSIRRENLAKPGSGSRVTTIVPLWQRVGVVLLVAAIAGAILALQNIAGRTVVLDSFRQLEQDSANRSLDQVLYAFQADLEHLTTSTLDYARWDDVYVFVNDRNDRFLHSNFAPESLE